MSSLKLERRDETDRTTNVGPVSLTPLNYEDYWTYRVRLSERQAVVGFPKFGTIGIGFAVEEEDWNTNLPYTCHTDDIAEHIAENKGDDSISDEDVRRAVEMIQDAASADRPDRPGKNTNTRMADFQFHEAPR